MDDAQQATENDSLRRCLKAGVTRAQLLTAAGAGLAMAVAPGITSAAGGAPATSYPFYPLTKATYAPEQIFDIGAVLHTTEHLAVALLATAAHSPALNLQSNPTLLRHVQAVLMEEQLHLEFLGRTIGGPFTGRTAPPFPGFFLAIGGTPVEFTVPNPAFLTDLKTFLSTWETAENLFVAMYMTATREFAELGQPTLAKNSAAILGVEAEHRVLARVGLATSGGSGIAPTNNKAFETDYLLYVRDAVGILVQLGFFNGSGPPLLERSPAQVRAAAGPMATQVIQQEPNNAGSTDVSTLPGERT